MKKLYFIAIAAFGMFSTALAQRTVDLSVVLTNHVPGSVKAPGVYELEFDLVNNGPDNIEPGDTIWFAYFIGDDLFGTDGTPNSVNGIVYPATAPAIEPQGTLPWMVLTSALGTISVDVSGVTAATDVCAFVYPGMGDVNNPTTPDPNPANNLSCFDIDPSLANINELSFNDVVNIAAIDGSIEISAANGENLTYNVVSLTGQTVANGTFNNFVSVDASNVNAGIYVVSVTNGTEKVNIKVAL
jgi:hypothetical protein